MLNWLREILCRKIDRELNNCYNQCAIFEAEITELHVENDTLKTQLENCRSGAMAG